jgi:signal transduction histidine kinase
MNTNKANTHSLALRSNRQDQGIVRSIQAISEAIILVHEEERIILGLMGGGLVDSIEALVEDLRVANLFDIWFDHSKSCDIEGISQSKRITLFRAVQEQTRNIVKYSQAKEMEISLHCCSDQVRLMIKDDGIGFDPPNTRRGLGLSNIYELTRLHGGKVVLATAPGKGCSVIVNIPIDPHDISLQSAWRS